MRGYLSPASAEATDVLYVLTVTLIGASGFILTIIMCKSMNRSLTKVLFGGLGTGDDGDKMMDDIYEGNITETSLEEVAMALETANRVVIVLGYGRSVGQAQHAVTELAELLQTNGVDVEFRIHPVAGRMVGHMNALLAEADVSYEKMRELEKVNPTFSQKDVVIVNKRRLSPGFSGILNPLFAHDNTSMLFGDAEESMQALVNEYKDGR